MTVGGLIWWMVLATMAALLFLGVAVAAISVARRTWQTARVERQDLGDALAASKAATVALTEEALFLSAVLASVDSVLILIDRAGRVRFVNDRFEETFGMPTREVIGRSHVQLREAIASLFEDPDEFLRRVSDEALSRPSSYPRPARISGEPADDEAEYVLVRPVHRVLLWSAFPVVRGTKKIGVLECFREITAQRRAEATRERLVEELAAQARSDGLTGLANRRAANEALSAELERARRYDRPLAIVLFDLDHFKLVNDRFGHLEGDRVLRAFADVLKASARATDVVARWGGEEFLAILHEADMDAARVFAERVRTAMAQARLTDDGVTVSVTVSAGAAALSGRSNNAATTEGLVRQADQALYTAKRGGRNRVVADTAAPPGA